MPYAQGTSVSVAKSKADIEKLLRQHGASQFVTGWDDSQLQSFIQFQMKERRIRIMVQMPKVSDFLKTPSGRQRSNTQAEAAAEDEERRRWRALGLVVKAKLEAVETGIATFEEEFLPYIVTASGATIGDLVLPRLDKVASTGKLPPLLPEHKEE